MLGFLIYSAISVALDDTIVTLANKPITVTKSPKLFEGRYAEGWYFAKFKDPITTLVHIKGLGIPVSPANVITSRWLKLYLTGEQCASLISEFSASLAPVSKSMKMNLEPTHNSKLLASEKNTFTLECSLGFTADCLPKSVRLESRVDSESFSRLEISIPGAETNSLLDAIAQLPGVASISVKVPGKTMNRWAGPVVQSWERGNSFYPDENGQIVAEKYAAEMGLDGTNVTVTILDTGVDVNHTFFYDPEHAFVVNKTLKHRKIKRYWAFKDDTDTKGGHGTHCAGTIAGNAYCDGCSESYYNGVAPNATLAVIDGGASDRPGLFSPDITQYVKFMDEAGSKISSNSWGMSVPGEYMIQSKTYDSVLKEHPDKLFIFSAGNEGMRESIGSPGTANNVLTVGAADVVPGHGYEPKFTGTLYNSYRGYQIPVRQLISHGMPAAGEITNMFLCSDEQSSTCLDMIAYSDTWMDNLMSLSGTNPVVIYSCPSSMSTNIDADIQRYVFTTTYSSGYFDTYYYYYYYPFSFTPDESSVLDVGRYFAEFSSRGPTATGIIKPDVMAPGTMIKSASALPKGEGAENHGGLTSMNGTSMATPMVAGAAALIQQYFEAGYYAGKKVTPSGVLIRAMLVASADSFKLAEGIPETKPNAFIGHGMVNLENVLPPTTDADVTLRIAQNVMIYNENHFTAKIKCTGRSRPLRISMSHLDVGGAFDSPMPMFIDVDLVVVSPTDKIFYGNSNSNRVHEHFSTSERIIIDTDDLEIGEYVIHIVSRDMLNIGTPVSVVCVGQIDGNGDLEFTTATSNVPCNGHGSATSNRLCKCDNQRVGLLCQIPVITTSTGEEHLLYPNEPIYFSFDVREWTNTKSYFIVKNTRTDHGSFILYLKGDALDSDVPFAFETVTRYDRSVTTSITGLQTISGMIVNTMPYSTDSVSFGFALGEQLDPATVKSDAINSSDNSTALVLGWAVAGVLAIIVCVLAAPRCKRLTERREIQDGATSPTDYLNP